MALAFGLASIPGWAQSSEVVQLLYSTPITVSGMAVDSAGEPVQGVRVEHLAARTQFNLLEPPAETDGSGRFRFDTIAPTAVFRKDGFESQLVKLSRSQNGLRIVLQAAPPMDSLPNRKTTSGCVSVTGIFCFPKIKGVHVGDIGGSIDAIERTFTVGHSEMTHGTGPSWGGPEPRSSAVWSSVEYSERTHSAGGSRIIDARGKTSDGKLWRSLSVRNESASYYNFDSHSAAIMDRVLDGVVLIQR